MLEIKSLIENTRCDIEKTKNDILDRLKTEIDRITDLISNLTNRVNALEKRNNSLERRHIETFDYLNDKIMKYQALQEEKNAEVMNEFEQRLIRRNNVIIFGVAEQEEGQVGDRRDEDMNAVKEILSEIDCETHTTFRVQRIGNCMHASRRAGASQLSCSTSWKTKLQTSTSYQDLWPR